MSIFKTDDDDIIELDSDEDETSKIKHKISLFDGKQTVIRNTNKNSNNIRSLLINKSVEPKLIFQSQLTPPNSQPLAEQRKLF